jgi:hypothetical protein
VAERTKATVLKTVCAACASRRLRRLVGDVKRHEFVLPD